MAQTNEKIFYSGTASRLT